MKSKTEIVTPAAPGTGPTPEVLLNREDLDVLQAAFTESRLGVKVQSFNRERNRAMLVLYLQHTDVQDRLEQADRAWSFEVVGQESGPQSVFVRGRLTLKGVSRENIGEGGDPKSALSDSLKRCAMLFGVGRYLYDMPTVWTEYDESRDRYRHWKVEDYQKALQAKHSSAAGSNQTALETGNEPDLDLKPRSDGQSQPTQPRAVIRPRSPAAA